MPSKRAEADTSQCPPMDDVDRWLLAQDIEAERLYRRYPEAFQGIDIPESWKKAAGDMKPEEAA